MRNSRVDKIIRDPKRSLLRLAAPIMVAMVVQTMYNIVDTAFVGRLGAESIAALTFSFPIFFVLISINSGIASGMSSRISRYLGEKNKKQAENTAMHGLFISIALAIIIIVTGLLSLEELFSLLGASGQVLAFAMEYMSIIIIGTIFMFTTYVITNIFQAQGDTKTPMKIQISALILNIILDPIFIYVLGYGVKGAAIASIISFFTALIISAYFLKKKSHLHISMKSFKFSKLITRQIISVGAPASLMMLLLSFYIAFLNRFMVNFGTEYVAAFGIASRLESVAVMPLVALTMSMMTVIGIIYGAKRYDLLKSTSWYGIRIGIIFTSVIALIFFSIPKLFLMIFTPDTTLLDIGSAYLKIEVFTFPLMAISMMISRIMQAMGYGMPGLIINLIRIFIVAVPLAYFFVFVLGWGYLSIAIAMVLGGIAASTTAIIWLNSKIRKMDEN